MKKWQFAAQITISVLIVFLLLSDADLSSIGSALRQSQWIWLGGALILKMLSLLLHEYRLWLALTAPRPKLTLTMQIGFASGALNLVLPARAGDIAAIALLKKMCNLRSGIAAYAVGMAAFFEAAMFGLSMLIVLLLHAPEWKEKLGETLHAQTFQWITLFTFGGIAIAILTAIIGIRLRPQEDQVEGFSPKQMLLDAIQQTGRGFRQPLYITLNILAASIEVWMMVASFAMALIALGIAIPNPWAISGLILGFSALASIVLPPTYGAGTTAACVFVLGLFGIDQSLALAYSALWWLVSQVPATILGLPCLIALRNRS